jgi:hypothetical protein
LGLSSPSGVSLLSRIGFSLARQKANLHPLPFTQSNLRHPSMVLVDKRLCPE